MAQDLALKVLLQAVDQSSGPFRSFGSNLLGLSGPAGTAATVLLDVGKAVIGIAAKSVQMAAQYQQSMNMVQALTGASNKQMSDYDAGLKNLAIDAGVAPNDLAQGLYQVISAGYKGKQAMDVLTLSTEDSKIGMTDAATTADALTNILKAFSIGAKGANVANGQMLETVTLGKSTFAQYASTITKASTTASQFHISLATMSAAWATMTANSIKSKQASTDFVQVVQSMYAKVGTITTSLHKNGIAFNETAFNAANFKDKVLMLNTAMQQAAQKHVAVTGVTLQTAQAIHTISQHIGDYNSNLATLSNKQEMAQKTQKAWAITQNGFNQTMSRVNAAVQVAMITIGQKLLPVLTKTAASVLPLIKGFTTWLTKSGVLNTAAHLLSGTISTGVKIITGLVNGISAVVGWFNKASPAAMAVRDALIAIGAAIAIIKIGNFIATIPTLLAQLGAWLAATWAQVAAEVGLALAEMAANWPIYLIIAAVLILIGIVILLATHWKQVVAWLRGAWQAFSSWFMGALHATGNFFASIWNGIKNFFVGLWTGIVSFFKAHILLIIAIVTGPLGALIILIITHWSQIKAFFTGLWKDIVNIFNQAKEWVMGTVTSLWAKISSFFSNLPAQALQWGKNIIQGFINGIKNMLGAVGNVASSVVGTVKNFLGFHSPAKMGPGADADQWAPNFMKMFSSGLTNSIPALQAAVNVAATPLNKFAAAPNTASVPVPASTPVSAAGGGAQTNNISIVIYAKNANADEVARKVEQRLNSLLKRSGNLTTVTSGGKAP